MRLKRVALGVTMLALMGLAIAGGRSATTDVAAAPAPGPHGQPEPDMLGVQWARGKAPAFSFRFGNDPHLVYHGGPVMNGGTVVQAIFWGTSWGTSPGDKITAMDQFYSNVGGTSYMNTNTANGAPSPITSVTYSGHVIDLSAAPGRAPSTSTVLAEVQAMVNAGKITPQANGYYPVYVDTKRGGAGYCAWHSWGAVTYNGVSVPIQFGFFFNLDGDSGCDPQDPNNSRSQGAEALGNVTAHELSEVATDPRGSAWYDRFGYENADKCAWTFLADIVLKDGSSWKIQSNFANQAYDNNLGSPRGCVNSWP